MSRVLLDTSVLIDPGILPDVETAISVVTVAELLRGVNNPRATVQNRRDAATFTAWVLQTYDPIPVDVNVLDAFGRVDAVEQEAGRSSRRRFADLLMAATALAEGLPLWTRNAKDFLPLAGLIEIHSAVDDQTGLSVVTSLDPGDVPASSVIDLTQGSTERD